MTVYIEKPAFNLREELASLRNQGGYQEQQFYFDSLVTNGTFDTDASGWTEVNATATVSSGVVTVENTANFGYIYQDFTIEVGKTYTFQYEKASGSPLVALLGISGTPVYANNSSLSQITFTATASDLRVRIGNTVSGIGVSSSFDNVSIYEADANDDVIHTMPKGWKPKDVFEDGLLQREGAANDYEVVYDGFDYKVKPTVAPSATTQTCVIGVKA